MEVETESEQTNKPILNVGDENIKEREPGSEQFMTVASRNEADSEFAKAIYEINGERDFPCSQCEKVCKAKGRLTRHTRSKQLADDKQDKTRVALTKQVVASIVESMKVKLKEENLYETCIVSLATVPCLMLCAYCTQHSFERTIKKNIWNVFMG